MAPNNASAWNYFRGVLDHNNISYSTQTAFVQPYAVPHPHALSESEGVLDLENPLPSKGANLPSPMAIEFLADTHEKAGGDEVFKAIEVCIRYHVYRYNKTHGQIFLSFGNHSLKSMIRYGRSVSSLSPSARLFTHILYRYWEHRIREVLHTSQP